MMRIQQTSIAQFTLDLEGLKEANKIMALPGQPKRVNFDLYSGYVTVDPKVGRALFYYFVESENTSSKPLLLAITYLNFSSITTK